MSNSVAPTLDARKTVDLFAAGLNRWNIKLTDSQYLAFATYADMLVDWNNNRFNLTRLISPEQIALNHFLDSVALSQVTNIPVNAVLIDIGTGAGFPGLAFKILRQDIKLVLIESTAKKLTFCRAVADAIGLTGIEFVHGRAEDRTVIQRYAGAANVITARAVAPLKTLLDWTAPLVATTGTIIAWKGSKVYEEVSDAEQTARRLNLKMKVIEKSLTLNTVPSVTHYYVVTKARD